MSGLIWIQTVWHSDGILESIFRKRWFRKKLADDKKKQQKYPVGRVEKGWDEYLGIGHIDQLPWHKFTKLNQGSRMRAN